MAGAPGTVERTIDMATPNIGIYCEGTFSQAYPTPQQIQDQATAEAALASSGFNNLILAFFHTHPSGNLYYNDTLVAADGLYTGALNPGLPALLTSLRSAGFTRIVGSIGPFFSDFDQVMPIIVSNPYWAAKASGLCPNLSTFPPAPNPTANVVAKNIAAVSKFLGLDGWEFDMEQEFSMIDLLAWTIMIGSIPSTVTANTKLVVSGCPYNNMQGWANWVAASQNCGFQIDSFRLQCYDGGCGQQPQQWANALKQACGSSFNGEAFVMPGLGCPTVPCPTCPSDGQNMFAGWSKQGTTGGWVWTYELIQACVASSKCACSNPAVSLTAYSSAIAN